MKWTDVVTSTSTGTGTTNTQLNGGTSLITPSQAGALVEVAPYQAATGAYTAAEANATRFSTRSTSIGSIEPKNIVMTPTYGGLGTFAGVMVPVVKSYLYNTALRFANTPIDYYGQSFAANTVAFRVGATVTYTDTAPSGKEVFWDSVASATSTGTTAATTTQGTITVNNGTQLTAAYAHLTATGTVTASESMVGYLTITSSDLIGIQETQFALQPLGAGLGTAVEVLEPDFHPFEQGIPMRNTATLSAQYTQEEALTSAASLAWGVAFVR